MLKQGLTDSYNIKSVGKFLSTIINKIFWYLAFSMDKNPWESEDTVREYYAEFYLLKPEETVLNGLRAKLSKMRMLDIGVGAGRTTRYFAPLAKEYIGVDISKNMIRACRRKFRNYPKKISFEVADARDLSSFRDNYFDFSLFSANGIDRSIRFGNLEAEINERTDLLTPTF